MLINKYSLAACGVYYWIWTSYLPRRGNYTIRQTVIVLDNGAQTHKLNKVPNSQLSEWDAQHDVVGKGISTGHRVDSKSSSGDDGVIRQQFVEEKTHSFKEV